MEKRGVVTPDSHSDFDMSKKAEFFDSEGFEIADKDNVDKLCKPKEILDDND